MKDLAKIGQKESENNVLIFPIRSFLLQKIKKMYFNKAGQQALKNPHFYKSQNMAYRHKYAEFDFNQNRCRIRIWHSKM